MPAAILVATADDNVRWNLTVDEWRAIACAAAGRNPTRDEGDRLVVAGEYRAVCPDQPIDG